MHDLKTLPFTWQGGRQRSLQLFIQPWIYGPGIASGVAVKSYYNSSSVCLCVRSLSPPRSFDGSSPNLVAVCRWTSHLPLRGSFSKRSTGRRVNGSLSLTTILYMRQPHATQLKKPFAALHLNGVCRWTSQLPLSGSFSKTSTGRRVNGSLSLSLYYI